MPTIKYLIEGGAKKIIIISHLGRPDGEIVNSLSLKPVAEELQRMIKEPVRFLSQCVGENVTNECKNCSERLVLLENLRFHVEEEGKCKRKDGTVIIATEIEIKDFRASLSELGEIYVNDAFGTVHRAHSSISGISIKTRVAGLLVKKELEFFSRAVESSEKIHTLILGGAKVSDKILLIENMLPKVENIIIGGGMAFTFLHILKGMNIGKSLYDQKGSENIQTIMKKAEELGVSIHLPIDFVEAETFSEGSQHKIVEDNIEEGWLGLDIGPKTSEIYSNIIKSASKNRVIIWNGPMGVFEWTNFANGTIAILDAMNSATNIGCVTIVGGGDSAAAVSKWHREKDLSHISTGGGASLELLEGIPCTNYLTN